MGREGKERKEEEQERAMEHMCMRWGEGGTVQPPHV